MLNSIREEIEAACSPKLIVDGSKPFRVVLESYEADHVQVGVNCHFEVVPYSGEYVEMKQTLMLAIAVAMKRHGIRFAIPSIHYQTTSKSPDGPL